MGQLKNKYYYSYWKLDVKISNKTLFNVDLFTFLPKIRLPQLESLPNIGKKKKHSLKYSGTYLT